MHSRRTRTGISFLPPLTKRGAAAHLPRPDTPHRTPPPGPTRSGASPPHTLPGPSRSGATPPHPPARAEPERGHPGPDAPPPRTSPLTDAPARGLPGRSPHPTPPHGPHLFGDELVLLAGHHGRWRGAGPAAGWAEESSAAAGEGRGTRAAHPLPPPHTHTPHPARAAPRPPPPPPAPANGKMADEKPRETGRPRAPPDTAGLRGGHAPVRLRRAPTCVSSTSSGRASSRPGPRSPPFRRAGVGSGVFDQITSRRVPASRTRHARGQGVEGRLFTQTDDVTVESFQRQTAPEAAAGSGGGLPAASGPQRFR